MRYEFKENDEILTGRTYVDKKGNAVIVEEITDNGIGIKFVIFFYMFEEEKKLHQKPLRIFSKEHVLLFELPEIFGNALEIWSTGKSALGEKMICWTILTGETPIVVSFSDEDLKAVLAKRSIFFSKGKKKND